MNSVLDSVNNICRSIIDTNQEPISFKQFISLVRKLFKRNNFSIVFKSIKCRYLDESQFYIEAYYYAEEDLHNKSAIEVKIFHNFDQKLRFYKHQINDLLIQIFDSAVHEYRHQYQSKLRNHKIYKEHSSDHYDLYLSDPDEVDAYALSIAIELLRAMPKPRAMYYMSRMSVLSKMKKNEKYVSPSLNIYVEYFKNNTLIKKVAKKVYKNLDTIDITTIFK